MTTEVQSMKQSVSKALEEATEKYGLDTKDIQSKINESMKSHDELTQEALFYSLNRISMDQPNWTFLAAHLHLTQLYQEAAKNRSFSETEKYGDFYSLIQALTDKGIYNPELLASYSKEEMDELHKAIVPDRDKLFNYIGLFLLADRYLARDHDRNLYELPQERFMIIAMTLMKNEPKEKRIDFVKEAYWALSHLYMTVATPTLSNAGKSYGQLSSCFIDTVDDSLDGIYLNNWDIARLSKDGGGIGIYYGKVRALGSDIKKFKGNSSGVVPWIRLINDTAVSVDQLGQRQGAVAIYLDVFHKDIMNGFLDLKTNNGGMNAVRHMIFLQVLRFLTYLWSNYKKKMRMEKVLGGNGIPSVHTK